MVNTSDFSLQHVFGIVVKSSNCSLHNVFGVVDGHGQWLCSRFLVRWFGKVSGVVAGQCANSSMERMKP